MSVTPEDVRAIAKAIADANNHPTPDSFAGAVLERFVPPAVPAPAPVTQDPVHAVASETAVAAPEAAPAAEPAAPVAPEAPAEAAAPVAP